MPAMEHKTYLKRQLMQKNLDALPLEHIEMVGLRFPMDGYLPYKINVACVTGEDGARLSAWAFLGAEPREDTMPEVHIYTFEPKSKTSTQWKLETIVKSGELREEFRPLKDNKSILSAILKCCFVLKGARLLSRTHIPQSFLNLVRIGCSIYKGTVSNGTNRSGASISDSTSNSAQSTPEFLMHQQSSLRTSSPNFPMVESGSRHKVATKNKDAIMEYTSRRSSPAISVSSDDLPLATRCGSVKKPSLSIRDIFEKPHPNSAGSTTIPQSEMFQQDLEVRSVQVVDPTGLEVDNPEVSQPTRVVVPAFTVPLTSVPVSAPLKQGMLQFVKLQEREANIKEEISSVNARIKDQRAQNMTELPLLPGKIDDELKDEHHQEQTTLKRKHDEEMEALLKKQKDEDDKLQDEHTKRKAQLHAQRKADMDGKLNELEDKRSDMLRAGQELQQEEAEWRSSVSPDEMYNMMKALCRPEPKRRKLDHNEEDRETET